MGDYLDADSMSDRAKMVGLHDSTINNMEIYKEQQIMDFRDDIAFMGDRLIGLIQGNHDYNMTAGYTGTQMLSSLMGCKYLGVACAMIINMRRDATKSSKNMTLMLHHGLSSGQTLGASLNKVQKMSMAFEADVYVQSHDHKLNSGKEDIMKIVRDKKNNTVKIEACTKCYIRGGSYQRGYIPNRSGYAVQKMFQPSTMGSPKIIFTLQRLYDREKERYSIEKSVVI